MLGIVHYNTDGTDGVSLQIVTRLFTLSDLKYPYILIDKDQFEFLDIDNTPFYCVLRDKEYEHHSTGKIVHLIESETKIAYQSFYEFFEKHQIKALYVHNLFSLPIIPAASLGLYKALKELKIPTISLDHDFWQARSYFPKRLINIFEKFPLKSEFISHVTINSLDVHYLKARNIDHLYVSRDYWDERIINHNSTKVPSRLTRKFKDKTVFLVATRIRRRKGIENALLFVHRFNTLRTKLAQKVSFKEGIVIFSNPQLRDEAYFSSLLRLANKLAVKVFVNTKHRYFWDFYRLADVILYPTLLEGFGNQFLEAIYFKKPLVMFEYEVFKKDIKPLGFKIISLGSLTRPVTTPEGRFRFVPKNKIDRAIFELFKVLSDKEKKEKITAHNYNLLYKYFGPERLKEDIRFEIKRLGVSI